MNQVVNRLGAKMIAVIVAIICVTIVVCINPFVLAPTFLEYIAFVGSALGLGGTARLWEKRKEKK